jgi:Tfp pilus assembly protein PilN
MIFPNWFHELSRADFLTSVGLYVTPERITLVRMRKSLLSLSLIEAETREISFPGRGERPSSVTGRIPGETAGVAFGEAETSRPQALREAIRSLLPYFELDKDPVYLCLSPEQVVVQQVLLPLAAEENLAQVLEYEIQRLLPFRPEGVYYDYLSVGRTKDKIELLLFAVPKSIVNEMLDALAAFDVRPRGVETTITAVANGFFFCTGGGATGPTLVVGEQNRGCEMIGLHTDGNGWSPAHGIRFAYWLPQVDWVHGLGKEILDGCLDGSPNVFRWGAVEDFLPSVTEDSVETEDLWALGNERLSGEKKIPHPAFLPAVGAALRGLRASKAPGNLLPGTEENIGGSPLSRQNLSLALLLLLGLVIWGGSYPIKDEIRLSRLQREVANIQPSVESLRRDEEELRKISQEISSVAELVERRGEMLQILDELSRIVPSSAYISNLQYRNRTVELQGSAVGASNLVPVLERSPLFRDVGFNAPSTRRQNDRESFSLKAELERAEKNRGGP